MLCPMALAFLGCIPQGRGVCGMSSDVWAALMGQRLSAASQLRQRQGLSLQQQDWGTALDLRGLTW